MPMLRFLYITDVFCPWCYAFAPIVQRLAQRAAHIPIRVLSGELIPEPQPLADLRQRPHLRDFFHRLHGMSGQPVEKFLHLLNSTRDFLLCSRDITIPFLALQTLAPGHALEQMERLQQTLYREGENPLDPTTLSTLAASWGIDSHTLRHAMADPDLQARARRESKEAEAILGEFVIYPTLFLEQNGQRRLLARGFTDEATVAARMESALHTTAPCAIVPGEACGLDGSGDGCR